jgi:hypothetical protein
LTVFMNVCGGVLEPCPSTGEWVKVSLAEIVWTGGPPTPAEIDPRLLPGAPAENPSGRVWM